MKIKRDWFIYFGIPILLCLVAVNQLRLVRYHDLTVWKGGGFGMFSDVFSSNRSINIFVGEVTPNHRLSVSDKYLGYNLPGSFPIEFKPGYIKKSVGVYEKKIKNMQEKLNLKVLKRRIKKEENYFDYQGHGLKDLLDYINTNFDVAFDPRDRRAYITTKRVTPTFLQTIQQPTYYLVLEEIVETSPSKAYVHKIMEVTWTKPMPVNP